jgi:hypothetical protein
MNYKELVAVDKLPPRGANGAFPFENLPEGVLSADPAMQGYYIAALAAAQKIDGEATVSNDSGLATITLKDGRMILLTNALQADVASGAQTVEQQVNRALGIVAPVPIPVPVAPGPVQGVPFEEPVGSGNWWKYNMFGMKQSCRPPATGLLTKVDPVVAIRGYIGSNLGKQPPKSDETVEFVEGILGFMAKL